MAKPNYQFEKRQKELAKKRKQEEKQRQRLADKAAAGIGGEGVAEHEANPTPPDGGDAAAALQDAEGNPQA